MLLFSVVTIALLLGLTSVLARGSRRGYVAAGAVAGAFLLSPLMALFLCPPLALTSLLLMLVATVCGVTRVRPRVFRISALVCGVAGLAVGSFLALKDIERSAVLRDQYPFERLSVRLAYEDSAGAAYASPLMLATSPESKAILNSETLARLEEVESNLPQLGIREFRSRALQQIHNTAIDQFVNSSGFGVGRMTHFDEYWLKTRPVSPIAVAPENDSSSSSAISDGTGEQSDRASEQELWDAHRNSIVDFANADGYGWVKDRDHVAGFQSHGFRGLPALLRPDPLRESPSGKVLISGPTQRLPWQLAKLELVSLLKYNEPRAYISEHLPRMEELRTAPSRPVGAFERDALTRLAAGEDIVVEEQLNHLRFAGSIRAAQACLSCHQVSRGALLGAFSYEFRRLPPVPKTHLKGKPPTRRQFDQGPS